MSITELNDIREEATFGRRLFLLGKEDGLIGPPDIADAIYKNDKCFNLIKPGGRTVKYESTKKKDMTTLSRRIQEHFDVVEAYEVPGIYLLAYSILFNCSMDYLYGKIDNRCPNAEINDICQKTHLSPKAIEKLMSDEKICIEEHLMQVNRYISVAEVPKDVDDEFRSVDEEEEEDIEECEDEFYGTYFSSAKFWNSLIESDLYISLPEDWYRMACALYTKDVIKKMADYVDIACENKPDWETFKKLAENWEDHNAEYIHTPDNMDLEEAYRTRPDWVMSTMREMRSSDFFENEDKIETTETVYWGCAGKLDRNLQNYFHDKAERWCKRGPLPRFE